MSRESNLRATGASFKRSDSSMANQIASVFDTLMKKSIKQVRDF
jgi:hypothetical protein